jgi:hypothetical protein
MVNTSLELKLQQKCRQCCEIEPASIVVSLHNNEILGQEYIEGITKVKQTL